MLVLSPPLQSVLMTLLPELTMARQKLLPPKQLGQALNRVGLLSVVKMDFLALKLK